MENVGLVDFLFLNLLEYVVIVMGFNNVFYFLVLVDVFEFYIKGGGVVFFISDVNFGLDWDWVLSFD